MAEDLVKQHVITLLGRRRELQEAIEKRVSEHEAAGGRVVDGGQVDHDTWEVTDYRTGETLAEGSNGLNGFLELLGSHQAESWALIDPLTDDLYDDDLHVTEGLPESLCDALDDWIGSRSTSNEDVAEFVGWPVERVLEARRD
ncbi:hypothetical protein ACIRPH_31625 [Nocardiopsis sp. NPDC101807]|uniref:hypothetical protein n=1 Tax=Nocardiopsis sp. NPDC101807 TaxID=3364339 RepID=UPI0037F5E943